MKKSIAFVSLATLAVALPAVLHSNKALSAMPVQALAQATRLPIQAGSNLPKGMKLASPSGNHLLVVGNDGNMMVVTRNGTGYVWGLDQVIRNFGQAGVDRVELRADGSLGAYNAQGAPLWIAPARRDPSARLNVTDDGVLQLVTPNEILWASRGAVGPLKLPFKAGTLLQKGMKLASPSGNHLLVVGNDGNLMVTTRSAGYIWGTDQVIRNFGQAGVDRVELRADGSLGVYNAQGAALWKAPVTRLDPQATLSVTNDGILQLVTATDVLWASSGPVGPLVKEATRLPLTAGFVLKKGMKYPSPSGNFNLVLGNDSNLMVTDKNGGYLWGTDQVIRNFGQAGVDRVELRADGSFASYNGKGAAVWTAPITRRDPAAKLNLTDDGDLQLVAGNGEILWAHNSIKVFMITPNTKPCADKEGWSNCVELADPKIKIFSTPGTSASAVNAVANIYTTMLNLLLPTASVPNPKSKFVGFKVYITNNESWDVQSKLPVVGTMWPDKTGPKSGRFLQGGASANFLWISEQMIAKKGVKIRNDDGTPDNNYRTFDQVVHEMAHSIDSQLVDDAVINQFTGNGTPVESFPGRVQNWFAVPGGKIPPVEEALLKKIFRSRATFSIEGYRP